MLVPGCFPEKRCLSAPWNSRGKERAHNWQLSFMQLLDAVRAFAWLARWFGCWLLQRWFPVCRLKHMSVVSLCVIVSSLTVLFGGNGFNSQHVTAIDPMAAGNLDRTQVTIRSVSELLTVRLFKPGRWIVDVERGWMYPIKHTDGLYIVLYV